MLLFPSKNRTRKKKTMLDPRRDQPTISFPLSDEMGHIAHSYDTWEATNSGFWGSNKQPKNYKNCHSLNDVEVQFRTEAKIEDESGICSPPLWTKSPPMSPHHLRNYYRNLSPASKTQAIAKGQRELMEMVQNMPESSYELSLKDLVEHPKVSNVGEEKNLSNKNVHKRVGVSSRKVDKKGSGKIDSGGLYLKMVFPTSLGSKKNNNKKKNESLANNSSKVSPRPSVSNGSTDKDWWKKRLSASVGESESGVSSINSGSMKSSGSSSSNSSTRSNSRHEMSGGDSCWPFIRRPKSLSQK